MSEWGIVVCTDCGTPTTAQVTETEVVPPMEACQCGSKQFERVEKEDV